MTRSVAGFALALCLCIDAAGQEPTFVFRGRTDVVSVQVSVRDGNRPVSGFQAGDFQLFDNGVLQDITSTTAEALPVDVTVVLDTSGSLRGAALDQLKADVQKISDVLQKSDRIRLITFAASAVDTFGLQPGGSRLPLDRISAGGATSFYAALAAALMLVPDPDRPQLIFGFSDGLDNASFVDASRLAEVAEYSSASMYVALVPALAVQPSLRGRLVQPKYYKVPHLDVLQVAVRRTGGALYQDASGLPATFRKVLDEFRTSYVLRYTPRGVPREGWHDIIVKSTRRRTYDIRARKGYEGG
jgi:VWFA-related protein